MGDKEMRCVYYDAIEDDHEEGSSPPPLPRSFAVWVFSSRGGGGKLIPYPKPPVTQPEVRRIKVRSGKGWSFRALSSSLPYTCTERRLWLCRLKFHAVVCEFIISGQLLAK